MSIKLEDYLLPDDVTDKQLQLLLKNPIVRICNLYYIKNKKGAKTPFRPNIVQMDLLEEIFINRQRKLAIPKSRQHGISTLAAIIILDSTAFSDLDVQCSIVDQNQSDASEKLDKVKYAWMGLPDHFKAGVVVPKDNDSEFCIDRTRTILAGKGARGGTNQVLHISEWGPIAHEDPKRSREIIDGALPSASDKESLVLAESTFKGGKSGDWYELIKNALELPERYRTRFDWKVLFYGWYLNPEDTMEGNVEQIDAETNAYLDEAEVKLGIKFSDGQRLFYYKKKQQHGRFVVQEYPTFLEEMWAVESDTQIFSRNLDIARQEGRISDDVLYFEGLPVYVTFDIGAPANQYVWIFQLVGDRIRYLECLRGSQDCCLPSHWMKELSKRSYRYGCLLLPWDGEITWKRLFEEAGWGNIIDVVGRQKNTWDGINEANNNFGRCEFNASGCKEGLEGLDAYHCKEERDGNSVKEMPNHDASSHIADPFSLSHQAISADLVYDRVGNSRMKRRKPKVIKGIRWN